MSSLVGVKVGDRIVAHEAHHRFVDPVIETVVRLTRARLYTARGCYSIETGHRIPRSHSTGYGARPVTPADDEKLRRAALTRKIVSFAHEIDRGLFDVATETLAAIVAAIPARKAE